MADTHIESIDNQSHYNFLAALRARRLGAGAIGLSSFEVLDTPFESGNSKTEMLGDFALQNARGIGSENKQEYLSELASNKAQKFLYKLFGNEDSKNKLTLLQVAGAYDVIKDLYRPANTRGNHASLQLERLLLHFAGKKDYEIADNDERTKTSSGISMARNNLMDYIVTHYPPDLLQQLFQEIIITPETPEILHFVDLIKQPKMNNLNAVIKPSDSEIPTKTDVKPLAELNDMRWQSDGLCAQTDPEAFYPEKGGSTREAKKICLGCVVRLECLNYALDNDERFGIWGGLSERERRRLKTKKEA